MIKVCFAAKFTVNQCNAVSNLCSWYALLHYNRKKSADITLVFDAHADCDAVEFNRFEQALLFKVYVALDHTN